MMMKCGHAKNALIWNKEKQVYEDGCTFCGTTEPAEELPMGIEKREAKCSCGRKEPSMKFQNLAFFQFKGEGSKEANNTCKNCKYYKMAHDNNRVPCKSFEPHGAFEFDEYYCGCRGWE